MTPASRARALHAEHPDLTGAAIARRLGMSRQAVHRALRSRATLGRPVRDTDARGVLVSVRLPADVYARVAARARRARVSVGEWVARVVAGAAGAAEKKETPPHPWG